MNLGCKGKGNQRDASGGGCLGVPVAKIQEEKGLRPLVAADRKQKGEREGVAAVSWLLLLPCNSKTLN